MLSILRAQESVHTSFIYMYISVYFYKICQVLQSNVSILYFLRNYCNAQLTVSLLSANNLLTSMSCSFINVHLHTCKSVNRYFLSVRPVNKLQRYLAHYAYSLRSTMQGMCQCIGCCISYLSTFLEKRSTGSNMTRRTQNL